MPRTTQQRARILYIAAILQKYSDENHPLSMGDILFYLDQDYQLAAEERSVSRDLQFLRDNGGLLDLVIEGGQGKKYRVTQRPFDMSDLRLLAECVSATRFISAAKARDLVHIIGGFCSEEQAKKLETEAFLIDRVKTNQKNTLRYIDTINQAMARRREGRPHAPRKITFKYLTHSISDNGEVERRKGGYYKVSPYRLLINDGYYYLLAFDDKRQKMMTYRIDRMKDVREDEELREGESAYAEIKDIESYTRRVFSMFGGPRKQVSIRFTNDLLNAVVDRLGRDGIVYTITDERHFTVHTEVEISNPFYGWVAGFRKKAVITSPPEIVEGMKAFLDDVAGRYQEQK